MREFFSVVVFILLIFVGVASTETRLVPSGDVFNRTISWNVTGATDGGRVVGPTNRAASDTFVASTDVTARTYAPAELNYRIVRFSVIAISAYAASDEKCTFGISVDGASAASWSVVEAGDIGSPVCEYSFFSTGSDLDAAGEVCTRKDPVGSNVSPGSYWQIISNDRSGGSDCESVTDIAFGITVEFSSY